VPFPKPSHALVIRYSYLWQAEALRGLEEGLKDRPCAVVLLVENAEGKYQATVLPITHTPPSLLEADFAVEIPYETKRRLGLDGERSWIMVNEANRFTWPGPDLRMLRNGDPSSIAYGKLPEKLYERIRIRFLTLSEQQKLKLVNRTD
jgi:hypothetical protein